MGRKIKLTLLLLFVFIVGGIFGLVLSSVLWKRYAMSSYYNIGLLEIAIDAQQLSRGRTDDVLKRKVMGMPSLTQLYYHGFFKFMPKDDSRYASLWQVQKYYEISGDEIPSQLKSILESLPPRPFTSCELKRLEDAKSPIEKDSQ